MDGKIWSNKKSKNCFESNFVFIDPNLTSLSN